MLIAVLVVQDGGVGTLRLIMVLMVVLIIQVYGGGFGGVMWWWWCIMHGADNGISDC